MAETRPEITLSLEQHRGQDVVAIRFSDLKTLLNPIRNYPNRKWSATKQCWYVPFHLFDKQLFNKTFSPLAHITRIPPSTSPQKEINNNVELKEFTTNSTDLTPKEMKEFMAILEIKRYSQSTKKMYCLYFKEFMQAFSGQEIKEISKQEINDYILKLIRTKRISAAQQNQRINAIKFYYEKVLGLPREFYNIDRPRKVARLPKVLSEDEVMNILKTTPNIKHKAILATIYSAGLRRSELTNLRLQDVNFDNMILYIRDAKNKKDRTTLLSDSNTIVLKKYLAEHKPNYWLFEGPNRKQYSTSSIAAILKKSAKRAGINKNVTPHMLRHSFATHLLEHGVDIRYIQTFLGHETTKTTEIYTHISKRSLANIKSPLDQILGNK